MRHLTQSVTSLIRAAIFTLIAAATQNGWAQTPPVDDDDNSIISIIAALIPVCKVPVAAPASQVVNSAANPISQLDPITLTANCTNNPTAYEWRLNGTIIVGQTGKVLTTTAPATVGTAVYSVVAKLGTLNSAPAALSINVESSTPVCSNFSLAPNAGNYYFLTAFCTKSPSYYYFMEGPASAFAGLGNAQPIIPSGASILGNGATPKYPNLDILIVPDNQSTVPSYTTSFAWLHAGTHSFALRALGRNGVVSAPITLTVNIAATYTGPTVTFVMPAISTSIAVGTNQNLQVSLSGGNVQVQAVQFDRQDANSRVKLGDAVNIGNGIYQYL